MKENYVRICHELGWAVAEKGDQVILLKRNDDGTNYAIRGKTNTLLGGVDFGITPRQIEKLTEVKNGTANGKETSKAAKEIAKVLQELTLEVAREMISGVSLRPSEQLTPQTASQPKSSKLEQPTVQQKAQLQRTSNDGYSASMNSSPKQTPYASSISEQPRKSARKITVKVQPAENAWDAVQYEDDDTPVANAMKIVDEAKPMRDYSKSNVLWFPEKPEPSVHMWTERRKAYAQEQTAQRQPKTQELKEEAPWKKFLDEEEEPQTEEECFAELPANMQEKPGQASVEETAEARNILREMDEEANELDADKELSPPMGENDVNECLPEQNGEADEAKVRPGTDAETGEIAPEVDAQKEKSTVDEEAPAADAQEQTEVTETTFEQDIDEENSATTSDQDELNARLSMLSEKFSQAASKEDNDDDDIRKAFESLKF